MDTTFSLAHTLGEALLRHRQTIGCAESCTGGLLAAALCDVPGASQWFFGAVVSYDNSIKTRLLGVPEAILKTCGAVSEETALLMADGVRVCLGVDLALSVTGIAGPTGGTPQKPVGTVWIACARADMHRACSHLFAGDRSQVRKASVQAAIQLALAALKEKFPA